MKEGDIIEWKGVNKIHRGKVVRCATNPEGYIIRMDIRRARSAKLIEV